MHIAMEFTQEHYIYLYNKHIYDTDLHSKTPYSCTFFKNLDLN